MRCGAVRSVPDYTTLYRVYALPVIDKLQTAPELKSASGVDRRFNSECGHRV